MKNFIKMFVFAFIFCILFLYIFSILWLPRGIISYFYRIPKNSMDVVYIGASNACSGFNPLIAYKLYGFKTGMICEGSSPFASFKYLLDETRKYQNPSLYVIDIYMLTHALTFDEMEIRKTIDSMKFNQNRFSAINDILKYANIDKSEYINYYFSLFLYHNAWKHISSQNFSINSLYMGYWYYDILESSSQEEYNWNDSKINLPSSIERLLLDLINYIKQNNLNVLFVVPKRWYWHPSQEQLNTAISIIKDNELDIINFNNINDMDINFKNDFHDEGHLNLYGATKYTLYFSKYLNENYNFIKEKNDKLDLLWDKKYEEFKQNFKLQTGQELEDFIIENNY